jgi:hypothetical protein
MFPDAATPYTGPGNCRSCDSRCETHVPGRVLSGSSHVRPPRRNEADRMSLRDRGDCGQTYSGARGPETIHKGRC